MMRLLPLFIGLMLIGHPLRASGDMPEVTDVNGVKIAPLSSKNRAATVLFFISHDCPISNGYAPEIERICAEYTPRKIAFYVVYVESALSAAEAKRHALAYGYRCPALLDARHALVKKAGATITPEAAVFGPEGKVHYLGRIDDRVLDFGKMRLQPTRRDLKLVLDAILQHKPVPEKTAGAIGCFIPEIDKK